MKSSHKLKNERNQYIQAIKQPLISIDLNFFINQIKLRNSKAILQSRSSLLPSYCIIRFSLGSHRGQKNSRETRFFHKRYRWMDGWTGRSSYRDALLADALKNLTDDHMLTKNKTTQRNDEFQLGNHFVQQKRDIVLRKKNRSSLGIPVPRLFCGDEFAF